MKRTIEKAAVAMVTVLVGACTEAGDERGRQGASDGDAASSGGAYGNAAGSGGARATGGTATGGTSIGGGGTGGREAGTGGHEGQCFPPLVPDAGSTPMYECSSDVTRPTSWDRAFGCAVAAGAPGCPARWGCGMFAVARETVRACSADSGTFGQFEGRELGFLVIGEFSEYVVRGYYDEATGEMVGYFRMDDVGGVICAGRVPKETFGLVGRGLATGVVPLCAPDGGVLVDAGKLGPSVDAADSG